MIIWWKFYISYVNKLQINFDEKINKINSASTKEALEKLIFCNFSREKWIIFNFIMSSEDSFN